jgi:PKD repeat protein
LLVLEQRPVENEKVREKITKLEEQLGKLQEALEKAEQKKEEAKVKEDKEKIAAVEAQIATEEKRVEAFDNGRQAASVVYAFGTKALEAAPGTTSTGVLLSRKALLPDYESETGDAFPLLEPRGITVDPKTHDLLIAAQEDTAKSKEESVELEKLREVVQRVHPEATEKARLGARYIDNEDCLEEAHEVTGEPACAESAASQPGSPTALPNGHVIVEQEQALWEIPDQEGLAEGVASTEAVKNFHALPHRVYQLAGQGQIISIGREPPEEGGNQIEFAETSPGHGRIYLSALAEGIEPAILELSYAEGSTPAISELGWTGGQGETGTNPKCRIPVPATNVLAGGDAVSGEEDGFVFVAAKSTVSVMRFGTGGEACSHAEAEVPVMTVKGTPETTVETEEPVTFASKTKGANALSTTWKFKNTTTGIEEAPQTTGFQEEKPTLEKHEFGEAGTYEVTAEIQPDDFGPVIVEKTTITVTGKSVSATLESFTSVAKGKPLSLTATVTDPFETPAHIKYKVEYGDGSAPAESETTQHQFTVEHTYSVAGEYHVKLTVTDAKKHSGSAEETITVTEPTGNVEAAVKAPSSGNAGSPIKVTASITDPFEAAPHLKYKWNFGDGTAPAEGDNAGGELSAEHAYAQEGPYTVTLEVEDAGHHTAKAEAKVTISAATEQRLELKLRGSGRLLEGESLRLTATVEDPFESPANATYTWQWGDGAVETTRTSKREVSIEHAYAKPGTYTVVVKVEDAAKHVAELRRPVVVLASENPPSSGGGGGGGTATTTTGQTSTPPPSGGVLSYVAQLASGATPVNGSGGVPVKVSCTAASGVCTGEVSLKTLSAVSASRAALSRAAKKKILTLATGHFVVAAGQTQTVMLHLSSKGKLLLTRSRVLKVRASVKTREPGEGVRTTERVLTLRLAKGTRHH